MAPAHEYLELLIVESGIRPSDISLLKVPQHLEIISSISLEGHHRICYIHLARWRDFQISAFVSVKPGSICHLPGPEYESSFEIAFTADSGLYDDGWSTEDLSIGDYWKPINDDQDGSSILENGWVRINSTSVVEEYRRYIYSDNFSLLGWLAQANQIFDSLGIRSNLDDYVFVEAILCQFLLLGPIENLPPGYLFLCPLAQLQTDVPGCFESPDWPVYWSRDSSGAQRLSAEEVGNGGFPSIEFRMWALGKSWDDSVYDGIRQFHESKGFNPYSQEAAIALGHRLFEVSCEESDLLAHYGATENDYSDSVTVSAKDNLRDFDEQYESVNSMNEDIKNPEVDSEFSDAGGEGSTRAVVVDVPDAQIDLQLGNGMLKDQNSRYEDILQIAEGCCDVCEEDVQVVCQDSALGEAEKFMLSRCWSMAMHVQFVLIITHTGLSLYDYFCSH
ncbi:hypothetical protein B0H19DRAFT_1383953 [Mycena capillaripes]|nr:hypothetical protein B0H19DRAFT_1383953 [Mycena capillaripes]